MNNHYSSNVVTFNTSSDTSNNYYSFLSQLAEYYGCNVSLIESYLDMALRAEKLFSTKHNLSPSKLEYIWSTNCESAFFDHFHEMAA